MPTEATLSPHPQLPLTVFISFSHRDDRLREEFTVHLSQLKRQGLIDAWDDRRITPAGDWAGCIDERLNSAHITIFLVSPHFLASDYCNDLEMARALERNDKGETFVVPVILRPCDWRNSSLARFQCLPRDGKPVVDWRTIDHGFEDVVEGLRRLIAEICGSEPVRAQIAKTTARRHRLIWAAGGGVVLSLALLVGALSQLWSSSQGYLRQGTDLLNVGRYADARRPLQQAKKLNPFSTTTGCGLLAVELDAMRSDRVRFEQKLAEASQQYPRCTYIEVLLGDQKYNLGDRQAALAEYEDAVKREPKLAEAYFDMGRILDLEGNPDAALKNYQTATQLSLGTARYANNLADLYFRREEYDKAIAEYERIARYPLAALEAAKIYRLQNKLQEADGRQQDAVRWLKDQRIRDAEAQHSWAFDVSPTEQVRLGPIEEKECYADLELSVTRFLEEGRNEGLAAISSALNLCSSRRQELKDILRWELRRLGNQTPELAPRSERICAQINVSCR